MNRKNKLIIYCLVTFFVFAGALSILAGCKRSSVVVQPTQEDPAQLAAEKPANYSNPNALISVSELNNILNDPNLTIIDARSANAKAYREFYEAGHIPGALALLRTHYQDPARWYSIAPPKHIQRYLRELGIDNHCKIVIYGNDNGLQGRIYWMFKMYGCDNEIQILDGGFEKWLESGYQTTTERTKRKLPPSKFEFNAAKADESYTTNLKELGNILLGNDPNAIIVDARTSDEFSSGHIPSSVNISINDILNNDETFKPLQELTAIFTGKEVTSDKNVFVYSDTGSQSSLVWFVLHELMGYPNVKNYDGGFKEWRYRERPIEKGV